MALTVSTATIHKDLDLHFDANPITGDVPTLTDIRAIKQSVINILRTNHGERPFKPKFGANLRSFLFEPIDNITAVLCANQVKDSIINWEPRVAVLDVTVNSSADRNELNITVLIKIVGTGDNVSIETSLERIR